MKFKTKPFNRSFHHQVWIKQTLWSENASKLPRRLSSSHNFRNWSSCWMCASTWVNNYKICSQLGDFMSRSTADKQRGAVYDYNSTDGSNALSKGIMSVRWSKSLRITPIGQLFNINTKIPIPIATGGWEKETNSIQINIYSLKRSKLN